MCGGCSLLVRTGGGRTYLVNATQRHRFECLFGGSEDLCSVPVQKGAVSREDETPRRAPDRASASCWRSPPGHPYSHPSRSRPSPRHPASGVLQSRRKPPAPPPLSRFPASKADCSPRSNASSPPLLPPSPGFPWQFDQIVQVIETRRGTITAGGVARSWAGAGTGSGGRTRELGKSDSRGEG
jgi:hypothetical protein